MTKIDGRMKSLGLLGSVLFLAGCGAKDQKPENVSPVRAAAGSDRAECVLSPLRLTLEDDWSCFPATSKGKQRGLGLIPVGSSSPGALMISQAFSTQGRDMRAELLRRLDAERKGLVPKYRALGRPTSERHGDTALYFVQGEPLKTPKAMRREGYLVVPGWFARFVEILPAGGGTSPQRTSIERMLKSIRVEGGATSGSVGAASQAAPTGRR